MKKTIQEHRQIDRSFCFKIDGYGNKIDLSQDKSLNRKERRALKSNKKRYKKIKEQIKSFI